MEEAKNESLQVTKLKEKRKAIEALELKYARINLAKEEILSKMENIQNSCKHEIVVKTEKSDIQDTYLDKAICLICNQRYSSPGI